MVQFLFGNLLITFPYYYAKYMLLTSLIWLIFSDFFKNFDPIKLLAESVYVKHSQSDVTNRNFSSDGNRSFGFFFE